MPPVLFLNLYSTLGGAENALLHLLGALDRGRYRPLVVVGRDGPLVSAARELGVEAVVVPFPAPPLYQLVLPWVLLREIRASLLLLRLVRAGCVRILQVGDVLGLLLALPARLAGVRILYQANFLGNAWRMAAMNLLALFAADRIVVFSQAQRRDLLARTVLLGRKTAVVPPGIDVETLAAVRGRDEVRQDLGIPAGQQVVGMVARFDAWKGHRIFLEAAAALVRRRSDVHFLVVGGSLNEELLPHVADYREAVLSDLRRLGLEGRVRLLGYVVHLPDVMAAMDVLVCPSENEPFGLVVVEALAVGTPVVVSDSGGPPEIVEPERSGLVFPTGDAAALAERVQRALEDDDLRRALAAEGRKRARAAFGRVRYARDMEALYAGLA